MARAGRLGQRRQPARLRPATSGEQGTPRSARRGRIVRIVKPYGRQGPDRQARPRVRRCRETGGATTARGRGLYGATSRLVDRVMRCRSSPRELHHGSSSTIFQLTNSGGRGTAARRYLLTSRYEPRRRVGRRSFPGPARQATQIWIPRRPVTLARGGRTQVLGNGAVGGRGRARVSKGPTPNWLWSPRIGGDRSSAYVACWRAGSRP